ncbi:MAG: hypothetical protein JRF33_04190 [Deltaproteobacteria bacterium]|nr:hypothetical protein [Deltaproteobacteria bacterium]
MNKLQAIGFILAPALFGLPACMSNQGLKVGDRAFGFVASGPSRVLDADGLEVTLDGPAVLVFLRGFG